MFVQTCWRNATILKFAVIIVTCFASVEILNASGTILFKLETYKNSKHGAKNGKCCDDDKVPPYCSSGCDNFFIICFSSSKTLGKCDYGNVWIHDINVVDSGAVFPSSLKYENYKDGNYENPHRFAFTKWNESFAIKIDVFDDDSAMDADNNHMNDRVESFSIDLVTNPGQNFTVANNNSFNLQGPYAGMNASAKVWCDRYYFIPYCTEYCKDRDDDLGHYRCNYDTASKECLKGWYGKDCTCFERDDDFGHYKCHNITGEKLCLDGWRDPTSNCTIATISPSTMIPLLPSLPPSSSKIDSMTIEADNMELTSAIIHSRSTKIATLHTTHPMPKLPVESTKTQSKDTDPNLIVYIFGLSLFAVLLSAAIVGMWKIIRIKKRSKVMPVEKWQTTRRKRTISTKTGLPPIASTRIPFKQANYDVDKENHHETTQPVQLVKVRCLENDDNVAENVATTNYDARTKRNEARKVTFSYYNQSYM